MAERREKLGSISLRFSGKSRVFDVYPSSEWPDRPEADTGLYRLCECEYAGKKKRQRWFSVGGQKYTFFTPEALGQLLTKGLTESGWLEALQRPAPKLRAKDWVRWHASDYRTHLLHLSSDPFLWIDGQWRVLIRDLQLGQRMLCCDELTLVDRFGREVRS
jgi:hypothetical protein